jgi:D-alanine-D-alanine ligase
VKILVLYGGESDERAVSLRSGARVAAALQGAGHTVECADPCELTREALCRACAAADAVFLALHGGEGEDGRLQADLESAGVYHYTGSDAVASACAMRKDEAKAIVAAAGVPVAKGVLLQGGQVSVPEYPVVLKPRAGGSSLGLHFLRDEAELRMLLPLREEMLCEEMLVGREYTVGVLRGAPLPAVEIRPRGGVYDYAHKYEPEASLELCPAPISPAKAALLRELTLRAYTALGLRDYARLDFREDARGVPRFLEANTLPGMTATSLFPLAAQTVGISFGELCEMMAALAAERKR